MEIDYRTGAKEDSLTIAELINIASDGVVEYLFHDLVAGMTPDQVVANNLEEDNFPDSYKSAIVAVDDGNIAGMALSFPASYHKITEEMSNFFPADRLEHLRHYYSSRVENSWMLDALGVFENYRRHGIAEELISLTKQRAIENGYNILSLICFADNTLAIPLYKRTGFEVVQKVELRGNEYIKHEEGCLLMKCEIGKTLP